MFRLILKQEFLFISIIIVNKKICFKVNILNIFVRNKEVRNEIYTIYYISIELKFSKH